MKKTLSIIIAIIIALSSITIVSYADAPDINMRMDKTNANIGDTVTVTVTVAENSRMLSATLYLVYNKDFFEIVSMTPEESSMNPVVNEKFAENKALYTGANVDMLKKEATLFTAQFKVLKRGGTISLEAGEVYYLTNFLGQRENVTGEVNESLKSEAVTVSCPHAKKTTTTVLEPTCAVEGKKVEKCKECGQVTKEEAIAVVPHDMKDEVTKIPTCKEEGKMVQKCTVCGHTTAEETLPVLEHKIKEEVVEEATCGKAGKKVEKCEYCDYIGKETEIPALTHEVKEEIIEEATCGKAGKKIEKCANCGYKSEEIEIPALAHDMEEVVVNKASCEQKGKTVKICKNCDYEGETVETPATGHTESGWIIVKYPTKTEAGREEKKCTVCGKVTATNEIPAISYKVGDVNGDGHVTAVDARVILQYVAGLVELTSAQRLSADTNKDGIVTAVDARLILQYVAGLKTSF